MNEQKKIIPMKVERSINGVSILCAPCGEFTNKDGKKVEYDNRLKVGNGFKAIADLRSKDQIEAIVKVMTDPKYSKVQKWVDENLPQSTSDDESEVEQD